MEEEAENGLSERSRAAGGRRSRSEAMAVPLAVGGRRGRRLRCSRGLLRTPRRSGLVISGGGSRGGGSCHGEDDRPGLEGLCWFAGCGKEGGRPDVCTDPQWKKEMMKGIIIKVK